MSSIKVVIDLKGVNVSEEYKQSFIKSIEDITENVNDGVDEVVDREFYDYDEYDDMMEDQRIIDAIIDSKVKMANYYINAFMYHEPDREELNCLTVDEMSKLVRRIKFIIGEIH